jgi:hypothetical protein
MLNCEIVEMEKKAEGFKNIETRKKSLEVLKLLKNLEAYLN